MMAFSGVRNSWLIFARNSDFARLAIADSMLAARKAFSDRLREINEPRSAV
jgi:hypothetical protein